MAIVTLDDCPVTTWTILRSPQPVLTGDESGYSDEITFMLPYEDAFTFFSWAGGLKQTIETAPGITVERIVPLSHPEIPSMLVRALRMERFGTPQETTDVKTIAALYNKAKITATFKSVPWPTDGSAPFMEIEHENGMEVYTIGTAKYRFFDGTPIDADAGLSVPISRIKISIFQCPQTGADLSDSLIGKLNSTIFMGKPPGTVRHDGMSTRFSRAANFVDQWSRHLVLSYRPVHWNYFLHPSGAWQVAVKPDGNPAYELADLNQLLSV